MAASGSENDKFKAIFEAEDGSEIAAIWAQVKIRVVQLAGGDERKLKQGIDIEDILRAVESAQAKDKKAQEKYGMIKNIFNKTLQCIAHVGGIIASGASQVFGPSQLAFNALSFVITAWQGYEGVFESLAGLLEKCLEFLDRLTYYVKGGMDLKLQRVACQHLQLFVEICDRTVKLRDSKRMKLKVFSKVFFLNDNDIQGLLDMMGGLVDKEGHLVAAQTFNFSSEAAANSKEAAANSKDAVLVGHRIDNKIDTLVDEKMDQKKEKDITRRREAILRALAFEDDMMDKDKKEPLALWRSSYNNYRRLIVPGTGEWIANESQFVAWETGKNGPPILMIEGGEGTGKSYLTSAVVRHLQSHNPQDVSGSRTSVAFYFLEGDNKDGSKSLNSLDMVSKAVVWQFSQGDVSYQKSIASICEKVQALDPHEVWTQLLLDNKDRDRIDTTFFIVIDGLTDSIDDRFIAILRKVSESQGERRIRVLLTGNDVCSEQLSSDGAISFSKIVLGAEGNNQADVDKYIDLRMDQMEALKDPKRPEIQELRDTIRNRLREETKGDYFKLDTNLSKISSVDTINEINEVLENAGKERSDQIIGEFDKLNKTRTTKEIQEINLLALWVLYARQWSTAPQLEELLYQHNGQSSLLSLETKIKTRYTIFEIDNDGDVAFKSSDIPVYLPVKDKLSETDITLAQSASVQASEVAIVEHFLHTVCPPQLYTKFGFEDFFERHKQGNQLNHIYQDSKDNAEIKLALICLRVLTEERDTKTTHILNYASLFLPTHLQSVDLALVYRDGKSEVGKRLLKLFTDEDCVDSLFFFQDPWQMGRARYTWLWNPESLKDVKKWFKDSAVVSDISDVSSKAWIAEVLSDEDTDEHLMKTILRRLAYRWLRTQSDTAIIINGFLFVLSFCYRIKHHKDSSAELVTEEPDFIKPEYITDAETYAQELLETPEKDSLWEYKMALLYAVYSYTPQAEERARAALALDPTNWRASHQLAKATTAEGEAIEILKGIAESFGEDEDWLKTDDNRSTFATVLFDLGEKYWAREQYEEAVGVWTRSLQQNAVHYSRNLEILQYYTKQERWMDALNLLELLRHDGSTSLRDTIIESANDEDLHEALLLTAVATSKFEFAEELYHEAIAHATEANSLNEVYYLRFHYGNLVNYRPERENEAIELWQRALREDLPASTLAKQDLLPSLIMVLAPVYLRLARASEPESEPARDYLLRISDWLHDDVIERNLTYPPKLYLARYYYSQKDELRAKEATRNCVKIALEMLSDDSDDNDYEGYWRLTTVFIALEDDANAFAAWDLVAATQVPKPEEPVEEVEAEDETTTEQDTKAEQDEANVTNGTDVTVADGEQTESNIVNGDVGLATTNDSTTALDQATPEEPNIDAVKEAITEESKVEENKEDSTEEGNPVNGEEQHDDKEEDAEESDASSSASANPDSEHDVIAWCDGRCGHVWRHASDMYCCRDCIAYQFHPECYEKVRSGTLKRRVCDKTHTFLYIPKMEGQEPEKVERGMVKFEGKVISVEEWKGMVRKKYVDFEGHVKDFDMAESGA